MSHSTSAYITHPVAQKRQQCPKPLVDQPQIVCSSHCATLGIRVGRTTGLVCEVSAHPLPTSRNEECSVCRRGRASVRWNVSVRSAVPPPIWLFTLLRHGQAVCDLCANGSRRLLHRLDRLSTDHPLTANTTQRDAYHPSI